MPDISLKYVHTTEKLQSSFHTKCNKHQHLPGFSVLWYTDVMLGVWISIQIKPKLAWKTINLWSSLMLWLKTPVTAITVSCGWHSLWLWLCKATVSVILLCFMISLFWWCNFLQKVCVELFWIFWHFLQDLHFTYDSYEIFHVVVQTFLHPTKICVSKSELCIMFKHVIHQVL